jgi:hypothetical protein
MADSTKLATLALFNEIAGAIPHLHPFALTLLLATPSHLNDIKQDDAKIQKFLSDSNIKPEKQAPYLDFIHAVTNDSAFLTQLGQLHQTLFDKWSVFYPTSPCPRQNDSIDILTRLA